MEDYDVIGFVQMKVKQESSPYYGLRLLDPNREIIFELLASNGGSWTDEVEVPPGTQIVGLRCDTTLDKERLRRISL